jgi:hypothetical protein
VITTPMFQAFLEQEGGVDLERIFARYVYGREVSDEVPPAERRELRPEERVRALDEVREAWGVEELAPAPRAFTGEELRELL